MWVSGTLAFALCAVISKGYAQGSNVVVLTGNTFEKETQASTGMTTGDWFVKFYAPWCGHCKKLDPIWNSLADELKGKVNVAEVDCTKSTDICTQFKVTGYPTLLFFNGGKYFKFRSARDIETLAKFAQNDFKLVEGTIVPVDKSWWKTHPMELIKDLGPRLATIVDESIKDIQAMLETGEKPSDRTLHFLSAIMILLAALVMYGLLSSSSEEEEKSSKAPNKKKD